eukprot:CAMPEP_0175134638 /NCGR_PEP_ID=MMETSP0087-20121206/8286_1 /TAXON_ID=136419 /ORGANISM="Unknown Unknown, Strain D1" /LENGTH=84 /DNA_ID=CAMNT_0016417215 /DNA_START=346 /DNA_END=600 /DNA_ORIENTATION=-
MTLATTVPSEKELQELLMAGKPIIQLKFYDSSAGHAEIITGCFQGGFETMYYVHDPETQQYQYYNYDNLVHSGPLTWEQAVYAT